MIEVSEATQIILDHFVEFPVVKIPIQKSPGRILREEVKTDTDFPPFDRVMMDGIAINFKSFQEGRREFKIQGVQAAGMAAQMLNNPHDCLEAMTGAVLPQGCDTVVQYEFLEINKDNNTAKIVNEEVIQFKNVHHKGKDKKEGDVLLTSGKKISAPEVAILASVGKQEITVSKLPRVAIISTGDELVDIDAKPLPHQIRRSNVYALQAELFQIGVKGTLFHLKDNKEALLKELATILDQHDVLLLSGGVSMGKFDYLPEVFEKLGVEKKFHKIKQKPGKPFWFGVKAEKRIFAFPGNPVSTFMCFHRYFKPWLEKSLGETKTEGQFAVLSEDINIKTNVTFFMQVNLVSTKNGVLEARPRMGKGSGDHANLLESDGFLELSGRNEYKKGMVFPFISFR